MMLRGRVSSSAKLGSRLPPFSLLLPPVMADSVLAVRLLRPVAVGG